MMAEVTEVVREDGSMTVVLRFEAKSEESLPELLRIVREQGVPGTDFTLDMVEMSAEGTLRGDV